MRIKTRKISDQLWEVPKEGDMNVPCRIYCDGETIGELTGEAAHRKSGGFTPALAQVVNVAKLPGIVGASMAMADIHPGYGFAIGGVGAFDMDKGVISVAGVGFDINCGVRMLTTPLTREDVEARKKELAAALFQTIPAGVGSTGKLTLSEKDIDSLLLSGAAFAIERGYGLPEDLEYIEENGAVAGADPESVSQRAKERQFKQVGTLGSGNHYLEVQYVEKVYDREAARAYGITENAIVVSIHCGSRALGHQIGTDYLKILEAASRKYGIPIRDKELVSAPIRSSEGRRYLSAVNAGINCAFANRQALTHLTRSAISGLFSIKAEEVGLLYDVGHNTCKIETHEVDGKERELLVHRKGSTRAFGPGRIEVPARYRAVGQPLLVGGSMGTASYILKGTKRGMRETFGSAIHGAGRALSRMKAKKLWRGNKIKGELEHMGILVRSRSMSGLAEEAPGAYKDIDRVVDTVSSSGINGRVARLKPLVCIKG